METILGVRLLASEYSTGKVHRGRFEKGSAIDRVELSKELINQLFHPNSRKLRWNQKF